MPAGAVPAGIVAQILDFADQYRLAADAFDAALPAEESERRGYLSPAEDEALRPAWARWWRLHCAGLELLDELRQRLRHDYGDDRCFLHAFTLALVLVEHARRVRGSCHRRRILRKKLNEAEPGLGLPPRGYDRVQRRLTKARHIARLLRAEQRLEAAAERFAPLAEAPDCQALWQHCTRLRAGLRISKRRVLAAHLRSKGRRVATILGRDGIGAGVYALQIWAGCMLGDLQTRPGHLPSLPDAVRTRLRDLLRPGDVLLTRKEHAVSNHLLPGFWPHAILHLGDGAAVAGVADLLRAGGPGVGDCGAGPPYVLEARKDGVRLRSLLDAFVCDGVVLLRPALDATAIPAVLTRAMNHAGKPYDFDFDFRRSDRMVCSEVIYRAFDGSAGIDLPLRRRYGRPTLAPEDLLLMALAGKGWRAMACALPGDARLREQGVDATLRAGDLQGSDA